MNSDIITGSAEVHYKQILEDFFISVFDEKFLSSHGIDHHRRVWNYSKELLKLIPLNNTSDITQLADQLIIACYLHDIGMSVDPGIRHGKHSRDLCLRFLFQNNLPENDFTDVLEAIENHDNKEYSGSTVKNDLLKILSISDDLDAFGFIGIFRYSEIYLTREITPQKAGFLIRENAEKRFNNLEVNLELFSDFVQKQKRRYSILDDFFRNYNEQVNSYRFGTSDPSGFCGVIDTIQFLINNKMQLPELYMKPEKFLKDPTIRWFFEELKNEIH